jgi:hypothetical protein
MDFGALPPEINSARMYSGDTGQSSLTAAAGTSRPNSSPAKAGASSPPKVRQARRTCHEMTAVTSSAVRADLELSVHTEGVSALHRR